MLGSEVRSTDLSDGQAATTLNGENITINLNPPRINGKSNILVDDGLVDIEADNGVIHGIDSVLVPTSLGSNIVDIAAGDDRFATLVAAVTAAGLGDALMGEGPLTVFGKQRGFECLILPRVHASSLVKCATQLQQTKPLKLFQREQSSPYF